MSLIAARSSLLACCLLLSGAPAASASESCVLLPNGDFSSGLAPWVALPGLATTGSASAPIQTVDVLDASLVPGDLSGQAARMSLVGLCVAGAGGTASTLDADLALAQQVTLDDRFVSLSVGGFYEGFYFGAPQFTHDLVLVVTGPVGAVEFPLRHHDYAATPNCAVGISEFSLYHALSTELVDLLSDAQGDPTGLALGDAITLAIELRVDVIADQCDDVTFQSELWVDNVAFCDAWSDEGCALAGVAGDPLLVGSGTLANGTSNAVDLSAAAPNALAGLFLSLSSTPVDFKGGTLKPVPFLIDPILLNTSPAGEILLPFVMPAGVPSGTELWTQWAIQDATSVKGVALSNAIKGITP